MELTKEYARAYVEVLEVIKYLKKDEYNRIPKEKIELYEKYKDEDYVFKYDSKKPLTNQVSIEAKNVLANLFLKYISTQDDRTSFYEKERKEWYKNEVKKDVKLNPIFENKTETKTVQNSEVVVIKQNFLTKIFLKIKSFFSKK